MKQESLEHIRKGCRRMATRRALVSAVASLSPLPFSDAALDVVVLKRVIPAISERFGLSKEQVDRYDPQLAILIYGIAKEAGADFVARHVTRELLGKVLARVGVKAAGKQALRFLPLIGRVATAGISFALMKALINRHIGHCFRIAQAIEAKTGVLPG